MKKSRQKTFGSFGMTAYNDMRINRHYCRRAGACSRRTFKASPEGRGFKYYVYQYLKALRARRGKSLNTLKSVAGSGTQSQVSRRLFCFFFLRLKKEVTSHSRGRLSLQPSPSPDGATSPIGRGFKFAYHTHQKSVAGATR